MRKLLGHEVGTMLEDFCEAHEFYPVRSRIVRAAVRAYIEQQLENDPALRHRFVWARDKRLGRSNVVRLHGNK